ncbi:MAG: glycogen/starch synthase [Muribaculaceae bacterium]|nr:glycogen/starch synthase [Muribaculaceae bacterium]
MDVKKVLYISQEIEPYLPANTMSTFNRSIAQGLQERGAEVRTFMPKYGSINERRNQLHEVIRLSGMNIIIDDTDHPLIIKVATLQPTRLQVYFIDNDDYFYRHTPGKFELTDWADVNDERAIFFVRGTIETVKKLRWEADIVHCTGWITALAPLFIKHVYADDPSFRAGKIVYSLFADTLAEPLAESLYAKLQESGIPSDVLATIATDGAEKIDLVKLNKLAIDFSDAIIESSEGVPAEIVDYAKASGKPFLPYPADDIDAYHNFYKSL